MITSTSTISASLWHGPRGQFSRYGETKGAFTQVCQFIAVVNGIRPAIDDWVPVDRLEAYIDMAKYFGLKAAVDVCFVPVTDKELLGVSGALSLNTTRARAVPMFTHPAQGEAHVFLSRDNACLDQAVACGWYNLVVGDQVIPKPLMDHRWFGEALGYPQCCIEFFAATNDWFSGNSYYQAYQATGGTSHFTCNSLPKRTSASYLAHIPHSFKCARSIEMAEKIRSAVGAEDPDFQGRVDYILNLPHLCMTELEAFIFDGEVVSTSELTYREVYPLPPTDPAHELLRMLREGDRLVLEGNLINISRSGTFVGVYEARGDAVGPQIPFILKAG